MRVIFLGPPGVGKGTQAEFIASRFGIPKIATGDLLRDGVAKGTPLGQAAKAYMDRGDLVPDDVVIGLIEEALQADDATQGFLLDGFPRTVAQADKLSELLAKTTQAIDRVMYFRLEDAEVVRRLSGRRFCPSCKAVFHIESIPPKAEGVCDHCQAALQQRSDDQPETIHSRLSVYQEQTAPLIEYYNQRGLLCELDGAGSVDSVQQRLVSALSGSGAHDCSQNA